MAEDVRVKKIEGNSTGWFSRVFAAMLISSVIETSGDQIADAIDEHTEAVKEQTQAIRSQERAVRSLKQ